jgi:hypothetical protein
LGAISGVLNCAFLLPSAVKVSILTPAERPRLFRGSCANEADGLGSLCFLPVHDSWL